MIISEVSDKVIESVAWKGLDQKTIEIKNVC